MQIEQPLLLLAYCIHLLLNIAGASAGLFMMMARPREQRRAEPLLHHLGLFDSVEQRDHLLIDFFFAQPIARMVLRGVSGAAVVDVALAGFLLYDDLARDRATTVAAHYQLAAIGQFMSLVNLVAEQLLHASEGVEIDQRFVLAGLPTIVVADVADVCAIPQHAMDFASLPDGLLRCKDAAFCLELLYAGANSCVQYSEAIIIDRMSQTRFCLAIIVSSLAATTTTLARPVMSLSVVSLADSVKTYKVTLSKSDQGHNRTAYIQAKDSSGARETAKQQNPGWRVEEVSEVK